MSVRAEEGLRLQRLGVRLDHSQGKGRRQEGPEGSHQQGKLKRFIRLSTFLLFTSKICQLMKPNAIVYIFDRCHSIMVHGG